MWERLATPKEPGWGWLCLAYPMSSVGRSGGSQVAFRMCAGFTRCVLHRRPHHTPCPSMGSLSFALVLWWAGRLWDGLITAGGCCVGSLCPPGSGWPLACLSGRWWLPGDPPSIPLGDYSPVTMTIERSAKRSCVIPGSVSGIRSSAGGRARAQPAPLQARQLDLPPRAHPQSPAS